MNHFAIRPERKRRTEPERKEPELEGSAVVVVVAKLQSPDSNCKVVSA